MLLLCRYMNIVSFEQTREAVSSHPGGGGSEPEVAHLGRDGLRVGQPHVHRPVVPLRQWSTGQSVGQNTGQSAPPGEWRQKFYWLHRRPDDQ